MANTPFTINIHIPHDPHQDQENIPPPAYTPNHVLLPHTNGHPLTINPWYTYAPVCFQTFYDY